MYCPECFDKEWRVNKLVWQEDHKEGYESHQRWECPDCKTRHGAYYSVNFHDSPIKSRYFNLLQGNDEFSKAEKKGLRERYNLQIK